MQKYDLNNIHEWPLLSRTLAIGIVCLVILYLGYFFDLSGFARQMNIIKQQEQDLTLQVKSLLQLQAELEEKIKQLPKLKTMLSDWQKKLITPHQQPELMNEILKLGTAHQLHFALFSPGAEVKEGNYTKVPIKAVVEGTYHQIAQFISQVANMRWMVVIKQMTLTKPEPMPEGVDTKIPAVTTKPLTGDILLEVYQQFPLEEAYVIDAARLDVMDDIFKRMDALVGARNQHISLFQPVHLEVFDLAK